MEEKNPYIQQVADDYDMDYEDVAYFYRLYSKEFFEKLEEFIKNRANA